MKTTPLAPAGFGGEFSLNGGSDFIPGPTFLLPQDADLPARWQGRARFVVLETGFGLGHHFLRTWQAWRLDPQRCERLCFVAIDAQPPCGDDLAHAHQGRAQWPLAEQLLRAWPPLTPNLHSLHFEAGRVHLLLAWGDLASLLPALHLQADAFFWHAVTPALAPHPGLPRLAKALGRKAAAGATLVAMGAAPGIKAALRSAGFEVWQGQREGGAAGASGVTPAGCAGSVCTAEASGNISGAESYTLAHFAPRFEVRPGTRAPAAPSAAPTTPPRTAVVVGAGLAGAAVARALAQQGLQVTVLEAQAAPAAQGSGNAAGLFHGTVNGDDGHYARLFRAAALAAAREYARALQPSDEPAADGSAQATVHVAGQISGLLRLDLRPGGLAAMQALVQRQRWPADYVQALSAHDASERAGVPLPAPAWYYPAGGWISPAQWVRFALSTTGVKLRLRSRVQALRRSATGWQVGVAAVPGEPTSTRWLQADVVVLAHTQAADGLLQTLGHAPLPLSHTAGQVTHLVHPAGAALRLPLAGDGYALSLPFQHGETMLPGLLCGATRHDGQPSTDDLPSVTQQDHRINLSRLHRLLGIEATAEMAEAIHTSPVQGRAAWRLNSSDRLPIAGAVPCAQMPPGQRMDQARLLPREAGLFVLTALGARGLTLAPLLAQLVAAQACGAPWPLEQDLVDAVDPARWRVRAARRSGQTTFSS